MDTVGCYLLARRMQDGSDSAPVLRRLGIKVVGVQKFEGHILRFVGAKRKRVPHEEDLPRYWVRLPRGWRFQEGTERATEVRTSKVFDASGKLRLTHIEGCDPFLRLHK